MDGYVSLRTCLREHLLDHFSWLCASLIDDHVILGTQLCEHLLDRFRLAVCLIQGGIHGPCF